MVETRPTRDVRTVVGQGLDANARKPFLAGEGLIWKTEPERSTDPEVVASVGKPFSASGGLKVLAGNLGRAVVENLSALADGADTVVEARAAVFHTQEELLTAFSEGRLHRDIIRWCAFRVPKLQGMPELHKLITPLSILMDQGYKVAMVTDGRLSGASGKVPAAIHVTPESICGGTLAKVRDGDLIRLDVAAGRLDLMVDDDALKAREFAEAGVKKVRFGLGRQIFAPLRSNMLSAEEGASSLFTYIEEQCRVNIPL